MPFIPALTDGTQILLFVGALITTSGLLWVKVIRPIRDYAVDIHTVVTRELTDDGNGSTKSRINKIHQEQIEVGQKLEAANVALLEVQRESHSERQQIQKTLDEHIENAELHHKLHGREAS